jgi:hypothetical protein
MRHLHTIFIFANLLNAQFLDDTANIRTDDYGGSVENVSQPLSRSSEHLVTTGSVPDSP